MPRVGYKVKEEVKNKIRATLQARGIKPPSRLGWHPTEEARLKMSKSKMGDKHPLWKGGITPLNDLIRKSAKYKAWRTAVYERDNYTCVECGKRGGQLHADHIRPFAFFPELRFEITNGRTLCFSCHSKTPTYGRPLQCQNA